MLQVICLEHVHILFGNLISFLIDIDSSLMLYIQTLIFPPSISPRFSSTSLFPRYTLPNLLEQESRRQKSNISEQNTVSQDKSPQTDVGQDNLTEEKKQKMMQKSQRCTWESYEHSKLTFTTYMQRTWCCHTGLMFANSKGLPNWKVGTSNLDSSS